MTPESVHAGSDSRETPGRHGVASRVLRAVPSGHSSTVSTPFVSLGEFGLPQPGLRGTELVGKGTICPVTRLQDPP
jgi:hypothetical protein